LPEPVAAAGTSALDRWQTAGFALYVHWPFCQSKCPYCDFNSHVAAGIDEDRWQAAFLAEIDRVAAETPGRVLRSIFFGGGTPSLMSATLVGAIISRAARHWTFANDIEITLEANPTSVEAARFRDFREAGVNRVSVGVQALNDADLRRLGRMHDTAMADAALRIAETTFERFSFDLIYGRQDQSLAGWRAELGQALSRARGHLSLYHLTIEDGTVFGERHARGQLRGLPDEDLSADLFDLTQDLCEAAGLPAYEISNHAMPGQASRHNMIYWTGGDYAGIGPGAHGRLTLAGAGRIATSAAKQPGLWLQRVEAKGLGDVERTQLTAQDQADEYLIMGIRTSDGLDLVDYDAIAPLPLSRERIGELAEMGLVSLEEGRLKATRAGRLLLNSVIEQLSA
jgi:oxygen-independent coproporphyrinogen-3 oxidase